MMQESSTCANSTCPLIRVDRLRLQVHLAREFLRAGHSQEAIDRFVHLKQQLGATKTKPSVRKLLALSYLRLGEQENCLQQHTSESCLFPIGQAGVHHNQRGARAALGEFTAILQDEPGEMTARWLLNIAYMVLGEYPDSVPPQWLIPPTAFTSDRRHRALWRCRSATRAGRGVAGGGQHRRGL